MYFLFKLLIQSCAYFNNSYFVHNLDYINNMNLKNLSYELDVNHFIDKPHFIKMNNFIKRDECHNCFNDESLLVPHSVDWREKNAVTNVKNQGNCGSCWSFSTTGSIEGIHAIKKNKLLNVSEQQLVDCSSSYGNHGCQGGLMDNAFKYVIDNGLCSEIEYPYQGVSDMCQSNQCKSIVEINDYSDIEPNNEKVLMRAVSHQPISVAIQANLTSFRFYKRGVYQDPQCGDQLDHGVLIVGYGTDILQGLDYWIVKNSWTSNWGDEGYIKILRNYEKHGGDSSGMCGIASQPSFPIIN
jgi:cathepsin L